MRIVEPGTPQAIPIFHGQCSTCKVIVECLENEISYDAVPTGPTNRGVIKAYIKCPTQNCKGNIYLSKGKFQDKWVDPVYKPKEWQSTPIIDKEK
jgi:hypothetical protein